MTFNLSKLKKKVASKSKQAIARELSQLDSVIAREERMTGVEDYVSMPQAPDQPDIEKESAADLEALQVGFKERQLDTEAQFIRAVDAFFWAGICFHSMEQREAFFKALGVDYLAQADGQFYDGVLLAEKLEIKLPNVIALGEMAKKHKVKRKAG